MNTIDFIQEFISNDAFKAPLEIKEATIKEGQDLVHYVRLYSKATGSWKVICETKSFITWEEFTEPEKEIARRWLLFELIKAGAANMEGSLPHTYQPQAEYRTKQKDKPTPEFFPGDPIRYVPPHVGGDVHHPDCEDGFIKSIKKNGRSAFVWYYNKLSGRLNSTAQLTDIEYLKKPRYE